VTVREIIDRLLYLDKEYISSIYEAETGKSPETKITRTEGLNAGLRISLFSGSASSTESRSYSLSTTLMLNELMPKLDQIACFSSSDIDIASKSVTRWVNGSLSLFKVTSKRQRYTITILGTPHKGEEQNNEQAVGEETYFGIHSAQGDKFALITTSDYFSSGLDAFVELNDTVV
jgi:uncharacterized radical SAM superfamily Fe-S cluster-containing enzyme